MPVTLTIKQVPDAVAARLRRRAEANRRSLQRELLLIVERATAAGESPGRPDSLLAAEPASLAWAGRSRDAKTARSRGSRSPRDGSPRDGPPRDDAGRLSLEELWRRARELGAPTHSESAAIVRRDRDARDRR